MHRPLALRHVDALVETPHGPVLRRDVTLHLGDGIVTGIYGEPAGRAAVAEHDTPDPEVLDLPGRLVLPGLINLHAHGGANAHHLLTDGAGEPELLGASYLTTKATTGPVPAGSDPMADAEWTVWELLRGGTTTVLDAGSPAPLAQALVDVAERVGLRVHIGRPLSSGRWVADQRGALAWIDESADDVRSLAGAEAFLDALPDGGLVRGAVVVTQADAASDRLLQGASALAQRRGVPLTLHAAQNRREVLLTTTQHGATPLTRLHNLGVLRPGTVLAHAVFLDHHPSVGSAGRELALLAASGAAVAHCPLHLARRGDTLRSFSAYRAAGIPVGIGTDTFPRDLVREVGIAHLLDRAVAGAASAGAGAVVDAATRVGAVALGRPDLGRIAVGGPADLVVIDLREVGIIGDPVQAMVDQATRNEVEHVFVAGRHVVRSGSVVGLQPLRLRRAAQGAADELHRTAPIWHRAGRSGADLAPPPFPHVTDHLVGAANQEVTR